MDSDLDVTMLLDRQQARRNQGIPTLTTFVGPIGAAVHAWKRWNGDRPVATTPRNAPLAVISSWLAAAISSGCLRASAINRYAMMTGASPCDVESRWSKSTARDLDCVFEGSFDRMDATVALVRHLAAIGQEVDSTDATILAEKLIAERNAGGYSEEATFAELVSLISPESCPAILLVPSREELEASIHYVSGLLGVAPSVRIALAISDDVAENTLMESCDVRWRTLLREGFVKTEGVRRETILARLDTAGLGAHDFSTSLDVIVTGGTSPAVVDEFVEAACALNESEPDEDRARSSAERFLFGMLESLPQTVGVFQQNRKLEFKHGSMDAEADLLAAEHKLVVEIDGSYYHLGSKEAYRRDRKKDWLLQQHGYRVLRFLAEDVVARLEEILYTILAALDKCRSDQEVTQKGQPK